MKRRLNLQMIGAYIRAGDTKMIVNNDSFEQRGKAKPIQNWKKLIAEKWEERASIIDQINMYSCVIEEIYF